MCDCQICSHPPPWRRAPRRRNVSAVRSFFRMASDPAPRQRRSRGSLRKVSARLMRVNRRQFLLGQLGNLDDLRTPNGSVVSPAPARVATRPDQPARLVRRARLVLADVCAEILVTLGIDDRLEPFWSFIRNVVIVVVLRARLLAPALVGAARASIGRSLCGTSRARAARKWIGRWRVADFDFDRRHVGPRVWQLLGDATVALVVGAGRARAGAVAVVKRGWSGTGTRWARAMTAAQSARVATRLAAVSSAARSTLRPLDQVRQLDRAWREIVPARRLRERAMRRPVAFPPRGLTLRHVRRPRLLTIVL